MKLFVDWQDGRSERTEAAILCNLLEMLGAVCGSLIRHNPNFSSKDIWYDQRIIGRIEYFEKLPMPYDPDGSCADEIRTERLFIEESFIAISAPAILEKAISDLGKQKLREILEFPKEQ